MLGITGFADHDSMACEMFKLVAWVELLSDAYIQADSFYTKTAVQGNRLVNYLQLVQLVRRPIAKNS